MKKPQTVLSKLHVGDSCVIESFTDEVMKQKLLEMGCLPGETIVIDRFAPLGCPMSIIVSGSASTHQLCFNRLSVYSSTFQPTQRLLVN